MKKTINIIVAIFILNTADCQITKGNWLIGGAATFSKLNSSSAASVQFKQTQFQLAPLFGYFLIDKFAVGLKPSFGYGSNNIANTTTTINIGPLVRYYFLPTEKIFNLFTEGGYSYGTITGKGQPVGQKLSTFSISGGPALFFNSSVALEFIFSYDIQKIVDFSGNNKNFRVGVGFQFHLEKEK